MLLLSFKGLLLAHAQLLSLLNFFGEKKKKNNKSILCMCDAFEGEYNLQYLRRKLHVYEH